MNPRSQSAPPEPPPPEVVEEAIVPLERTRTFRFPHLWHHDPDWQTDGIHRYDQCRCGTRRTRWVNRRMLGPARAGWPELTDRHARFIADTGWRKSPPGGWPA
jgi:hypothetical protein